MLLPENTPGREKYPYPVNLVYDIIAQVPDATFEPMHLPEDFAPSVEYALSCIRTEAASILRAVYGTGVAVGAAGRALGLSATRTMIILSAGLEQLCSEDLLNIITLGVSGYIRKLKIQSGDKFASFEQTLIEDSEDKLTDKLHQTLLEELDLPGREYNMLRRYDIRTAGDIVDAGPRQIRSIRNCGPKSYHTIVKAIERLGVDVSTW